MPCKLPPHIFEVDDATAQRLTELTIRRRRAAVRLRILLLLCSLAIVGCAVAANT